MEWSDQVLLAMLALILGSMVRSIALAVQRWFVAAAISAAERQVMKSDPRIDNGWSRAVGVC